jgi:threonine/homoserine/homoserine lactone efflux protein
MLKNCCLHGHIATTPSHIIIGDRVEGLALLGLFQVFAAGAALGLSLAMPPGPINALIGAESAQGRAMRGFVVGLGAMTADTIFLVISVAVGNLISIEGITRGVLYLISAGILAYLAYATYGTRKRGLGETASNRKMHLPYVIGLTIGLTNPLQIAWWLSVGLSLIVSIGPAIIAGFFAGILLWIVAFPLAIRWASGKVPHLYGIVIYASAALLLIFAIWFGYNALIILTSL